jgi:hypothetical protein
VSPAEPILRSFDQGLPLPDARIFRFQAGVTALRMAAFTAMGLALAGFGVSIAPSLHRPFQAVTYGAIATFFLVVLASLRLALLAYLDLRSARGNVLIVTPTVIVRRRRGKVDSWLFAEFPGLTFVVQSRRATTSTSLNLADGPPSEALLADKLRRGGVNAIRLNRSGESFGAVLIDDASFGRLDEIVRALVARVEPGQPLLARQDRPSVAEREDLD